jgi:pSer/pThr/pTyr-binding forkhead associated (FHA) protein
VSTAQRSNRYGTAIEEQRPMALLSYRTENRQHEVPLTEDDVTIGRSSICTIRLTHDSEISRVHCSVQRRPDGSYAVIDAASKNGTFLNGQRLLNEEVELTDGDRIRVGQTVIRFVESEVKRTAQAIEDIAQQMEGGKGFQTIFREIMADGMKK